ncbi:MAG: ABC transporter permease [Acidaminococcales bacterium]|jgi:putative ABC transport system permease protein|nr:ABC transporter permease [Acidaminococcales bacterium]
MKREAFFLKIVACSLLRRHFKLLTAILAVAAGAAILSGLTTLYYDMPRQMGREFRSYGANLLFAPAGDRESLTAAEAEQAALFLPADAIVGVAAYRYNTVRINEQPFMAAGAVLSEVQKTSPYWLVRGDWPRSGKEALIGQEVADIVRLAPGSGFTAVFTDRQGKSSEHAFTVSGVLQTGGTEEAFIFMSLPDFENMAGAGGFDIVECSVSLPKDEIEKLSARINGEMPGLTARPVRRVTESETAVLARLQALVYLVTIVALLLTMISVATTMLAAVAERRREIGLKKALGAPSASIVAEFLSESLLLGGIGGLLGGIFGFLFAQMISANVFGRPLSFPPLLLPSTMAAAILVTGVASALPAKSAAKVDPAIVLRGE